MARKRCSPAKRVRAPHVLQAARAAAGVSMILVRTRHEARGQGLKSPDSWALSIFSTGCSLPRGSGKPGKSLNTHRFFKGAVVGAILLAASVSAAAAQQLIGEKLYAGRVGGIEPGNYSAGDNVHFTLDPYGDKYLLRIAAQPEVFVLHTDRASFGGRVLKYDSGGTALQVSGYGALTLYTDEQPAGLPAVREGDSTPPVPSQISLPDIQNAAQDETQ